MTTAEVRIQRSNPALNSLKPIRQQTLPGAANIYRQPQPTKPIREQHLCRKEISQEQPQGPHPAGVAQWYNVARLNDQTGVPEVITGPEARRILCYNATEVALGWDQWSEALEVEPSQFPPFTRFNVDGLRREACLPITTQDSVGDSPTQNQAIGTTNTLIPLQVAAGDTTRWDVQPDGSINVAKLSPSGFTLSARVLFDYVMGQNTDETVILDWVYTGTGTSLSVPASFPFQTSRAATFTVTMESSITVFNDAVVGDNIQLVARRTESQSVNRQGVIWGSDGSETAESP